MKPTKYPAKEKKNWGEKSEKKRWGEKAQSKIQDCCVTKTCCCVDILLSVHAWTSQANTLHLDQKVMKCMYDL